ncbi:MAG: hypothetical protein ACO1OD_12635 [Croceibacterium sp.]
MLRRAWRALRRHGQAALAPYPWAYFPFDWLTRPRGYSGTLSRDTEIVIEGFPRSANSWSVVALREAQPHAPRTAHHRHAEAQVLAGVKRGLPVLVLIRRPDEAIRSLVFRHPDNDPGRALDRWLAFYSAVKRVRHGVVIATFEQATSDFGSVVDRLNPRFGCAFARPPATETFRQWVFQKLDEENTGESGFTAEPDSDRSAAQAALPIAFHPDKLERAHALYDELLAGGQATAKETKINFR